MTPFLRMHTLIRAALIMLALAGAAEAAELKIFGSRVTKMMIGELGPQFEKATGHTLSVVTDVAVVMKRRIESGEAFDLAVLVDYQIDELFRSGRLVPGTRTDLMKSGIGVAVRRGAPLPDIATPDAFKRALLAAKSITYLKEGASTARIERMFDRLGITEQLKVKTVKPDTESVSEKVAAGDVELGIIVIPNILSVPGAQLAGPVPAEFQSYIVFTAGVSAQSPNQQAARDLIRLLTGPDAVRIIRSIGMEPG